MIDKADRHFRTKDGTVYGFTYKGKIYLDPEIATANTAIHEFTHLWAEMMRQTKPEEWQSITSAMKSKEMAPLWNEIINNPAYKGLTEDEIAEEVLATYTGREGEQLLDKWMQKIDRETPNLKDREVAKRAIDKLRDILNRFWEFVCKLLGKEHVYKHPKMIQYAVMRDLFNGVNPNNAISQQNSNVRMQAEAEKISSNPLAGS